MSCVYCEDYHRTKRLDRPDETLWKVDCPTQRVGIVEIAWFCAIDGCHEHIQSMYFTIEPIPTEYTLHEQDCDE